jgi:DNA-binding MarR family transcriptional regulator
MDRAPSSPAAERLAIMDGLRRIVGALRRSGAAAEREHGVSAAQLFVLQQLAKGPIASLGELAARTHTHQSSVSVVVRRLIDAGLVRRHSAAHDARCVTIGTTARGRALIGRAPMAAQERLVAALRALPPGLSRSLANGLGRLAAALETEAGAPAMFFEDAPRLRPVRRRARG